ncbi:uncharacterized protein At4g00950 [Eucalyptus grandis]|uniref:Uncharacterized protein n=4 Tax=Eucalyptus TaxID=3932 RepID=A0A059AYD5_EUCGR|nr:uncharacterized protein At4g00950 [Eucalyptus grandis]KAK3415672.1 hypothetical protein EUGRSUZ_H01594 [Eucalyptus grandis]KAK3415718.1 hypothetical protein EUGRSUZ_H01540 [Eucalyptus grandis]
MSSESEKEDQRRSTPKLSLLSLPNHRRDPSDMPDPPLQTTISVPFEWEEVPGKPKRASDQAKPSAVAGPPCLEPPPRLWDEGRFTNTPSPSSVLDGPYMGRRSGHTFSFRKIGGSFRSPEKRSKGEGKERTSIFGSMRWGILREKIDDVEDISGFSSSFRGARSGDSDGDSIGAGAGTDCFSHADTRRRRGGFVGLSQSKSHLWATLCENFKQVVPWRRKQDNYERV